jgi:hypothetical protein
MGFLFLASGWPHLPKVFSGVKLNDFRKALLPLKLVLIVDYVLDYDTAVKSALKSHISYWRRK